MDVIMNISEVCYRLGVRRAILSPGSRNAPLTISFARHEGIDCISAADERSAGFIALGLSLEKQEPVVLCCTSGSALANYFPAIIEAFHQAIPLIVLSADRPLEWIGQGDGQCIEQQNIYGKFVKGSFAALPDYETKASAWLLHRILSDAINLSVSNTKGPVHVNIPFREPFYPEADALPSKKCKVIEKVQPELTLSDEHILTLNDEIKKYKKVLIVVGQTTESRSLCEQIRWFNVPVIAESTSNLFECVNIVRHHDTFLEQANSLNIDRLVPDLVVTLGEHFISKNLKLFLRNNNEELEHWHVGVNDNVADVFQCLTKTIQVTSDYFFRSLDYEPVDTDFVSDWLSEEKKATFYLTQFCVQKTFSEFESVHRLMGILPKESILFAGNSMSIRYANIIRPKYEKRISTYGNRGASGIDGTSSTAVGIALGNPDKIVTLLVGDVAFLYDKNAFWLEELPPNLRVVVLNNAGGGIFNMIEGPRKQPELSKYFMTEHDRTAQQVCKESGLGYFTATDYDSLEKGFTYLYDNKEGVRLLEVFTSKDINTAHFKEYKELKGYGEQI